MKLKNKLKSNKFKFAALGTAVVLLFCAVIGMGIALFSKLETTKKVKASDFAIGTISVETGSYVDSKQSIYMEDMESVKGLKIEVSEDAQVTYKVAYYTEDENFISMSESTNEDLDATTIPASAALFSQQRR